MNSHVIFFNGVKHRNTTVNRDMSEELKYKTKLAGYKGLKVITSGPGQIITAIAIGAAIFGQGLDIVDKEVDPNGTQNQSTVLAELQEQKQDLITQVGTYQDLRNDVLNGNAEESNLETAQADLKQNTMQFFTDLLTNGSMSEGLDIGETDVVQLIDELQLGVRDFDWGSQVDEALPTVIERIQDNGEFLDEARAEVRAEGVGKLSDRFENAKTIGNGTYAASSDYSILYMIVFFASIMGGLVTGAATESIGKKVKKMRKPEPPAALGKH